MYIDLCQIYLSLYEKIFFYVAFDPSNSLPNNSLKHYKTAYSIYLI